MQGTLEDLVHLTGHVDAVFVFQGSSLLENDGLCQTLTERGRDVQLLPWTFLAPAIHVSPKPRSDLTVTSSDLR